jgi:hypothetical protein
MIDISIIIFKKEKEIEKISIRLEISNYIC